MTIPVGTRLGRYEVCALLGTGGMGEVYLARDPQLSRNVALKLIRADAAGDKERLRRFEQEARATSGLNHPNILTIYEIGQAGDTNFIAAEFVEGVTLRARLSGARVPLAEALEIVIQIAAALGAAHAAGVVHRDVKPENVMLRADGYVKVLDFGLAKLAEHQAQHTTDPEAETRLHLETRPGEILGTTHYMSPEQLRGLQLDARTDIWSLGVVLYELLAGRLPFAGASFSDLIVAILQQEPPPLTAYDPALPVKLEWIVTKALDKDREARYQTIKELQADLRRLKQELEFDSMAGSLAQSHLSGAPAPQMRAGVPSLATATPRAPTTGTVSTMSTAGPSGAVPQATSRRMLTWALLLAGVGAVVVGAGLYKFVGQRGAPRRPAALQEMRFTRLTTSGKCLYAAISPDGKYVAHVVDEGGRQGLLVRQVATTSTVPLVPPAEVRYFGLTFSHDGNYVYYVRSDEQNATLGVLYQVPVLGGASRKLSANVDSAVTLAPDERRVAFIRRFPTRGETALVLADTAGGGEQTLTTYKAPDSLLNAAWSPDGQTIACAVASFSGEMRTQLVSVRVADGQKQPIGAKRWWVISTAAWLADGTGLLVTAAEQTNSTQQIWQLTYPAGEASRITNDLNSYRNVSVTTDAGVLAVVQSDYLSNIWRAPTGAAAADAQQITAAKYDGYRGVAWTPDERVVYSSKAGGNEDIWITRADGQEQRQLTVDPHADFHPAVAPDGRRVVFISDRTGGPHLWLMDIDGGSLRQLSNGEGEDNPVWTPDGQWVVYTSAGAGKRTVWRIPVDGGAPEQLTDQYSLLPSVAPDGQQFACYYWHEQPDPHWSMAVFPITGGQPVHEFNTPTPFQRLLRWAPDGRALTYIETRAGTSNIWSQPLAGGPPRQLTHFKDERIFWFDWTRDGKQLACARGMETRDVVLISGFR